MTMPSVKDRIQRIFARAEKDGRTALFEHEVYALLRACGLPTPRCFFVPRRRSVSRASLSALGSREVVVKVVSPAILHKSDVGGVAFAPNTAGAVNATIRSMMSRVPPSFAAWADRHQAPGGGSVRSVSEGIRGFLVVEKVAAEDIGFGSELLLGLRHTREFGPVVTMGSGGLDVEYINERLEQGRALAIGSAHLLRRREIEAALSSLAVFDKLTGGFRGKAAPVAAAALVDIFDRFLELGRLFSPMAKGSGYVIEEAEVNPLVVRGGKLLPLDGLCRFSRLHESPRAVIYPQIDRLLRPGSIGLIGVSERLNLDISSSRTS